MGHNFFIITRFYDRNKQLIKNVLTLLIAASQLSMTSLIPTPNIASNPQQRLNNEDDQFNSDIFQAFLNPNLSQASPLGMDLGEFLLEGDLEFLNQLVSMGAAIGIRPDLETSQNPTGGDDEAVIAA